MSCKISVVLPVYNGAEFFSISINSILNQTFTDYELLIIDDGSKDNTRRICDEYAEKDKRIRVFHKQNGGVSSARNMGLDNAQGEWVTFIDSDDWIKPDYLVNLYACVDEKVDLVISFFETILSTGESITRKHSKGIVSDDNFSDLFSKFEMCSNTTVWAKLFSLSLINNKNIRFNERMSMGEDTVFLYSYLLYSSLIYVSDNVNYCYNDSSASLSKKFYSLSMEIEGYKQIEFVINKIFSKKRIIDITAKHNLNVLKGYYVWRVLKCMYNSDKCISVRQRLAILRSLDLSTVQEINNGNTIKWAVLKWLLQHRLVMVYDCIKLVNNLFRNWVCKLHLVFS